MGIFTTREAAEEFVRGDPFVLHGVSTELDYPRMERSPGPRLPRWRPLTFLVLRGRTRPVSICGLASGTGNSYRLLYRCRN